jgi:hypothetical protein
MTLPMLGMVSFLEVGIYLFVGLAAFTVIVILLVLVVGFIWAVIRAIRKIKRR